MHGYQWQRERLRPRSVGRGIGRLTRLLECREQNCSSENALQSFHLRNVA